VKSLDLFCAEPHRYEKEEAALKRVLYARAAVADIVLDLHCDCGDLLAGGTG